MEFLVGTGLRPHPEAMQRNFTAIAEPVQKGQTGRTFYFLDETQLVRCSQQGPAT